MPGRQVSGFDGVLACSSKKAAYAQELALGRKPMHVTVDMDWPRLVLAGCSRCAHAMVWAHPGRRGGCPAAPASVLHPRRRLSAWPTAAHSAQSCLLRGTTRTEATSQSLTAARCRIPSCHQSPPFSRMARSQRGTQQVRHFLGNRLLCSLMSLCNDAKAKAGNV